jgi:hypothetical protein
VSQEEYITHLVNYLCNIGKYGEFEEYLKSIGYSQDDIDDL